MASLSLLRRIPLLAAAFFILPIGASPAAGSGTTALQVDFESLRNSRGILRLCLNRDAAHYPDCSADPRARRVNIPANSGSYRFEQLPPGTYALTAMHDENGNGKLDTFLGIPREGFAFSNNPPVRFGPPAYRSVRFSLGPVPGLLRLRFKYIG